MKQIRLSQKYRQVEIVQCEMLLQPDNNHAVMYNTAPL